MQGNLFSSDMAYVLLVLGALFVHACYQLSVSVLTYMSSHKLSQKASTKQLLKLGFGYITGVVVTTALLLVAVASLLSFLKIGSTNPQVQLAVALTLALTPFIGLLTMTVYYRRGPGTQLWLPRPIARYLLERARKTKHGVEASMLGAATVVGELPFLAGPLLITSAVVMLQPAPTWPVWGVIYGMAASLPLVFVTLYLTSGHSVARLQKWREDNKTFLQWTSGIALVLLTVYLTVLQLGVAL